MELELKDFITIGVSCLALAISGANFYLQHFRKRDRFVALLLSVGLDDTPPYDTVAEYSVSNIGDNHLVVKDVWLHGDDGTIIPRGVEQLPIVLKPGEVAVVSVRYTGSSLARFTQVNAEFEVVSSKGKAYRLPHMVVHRELGHSRSWKPVYLKDRHEDS